MLRLFFFFAFLATALSYCDIEQNCDCSLPSSCSDNECCQFDSRSVDSYTFGRTTVATRCICCSCSNVTCSSDSTLHVDATFNIVSNSRSSEKPAVAPRKEQKPKRTVAEVHREMYEGAVEVRSCLDIEQECKCDPTSSCSALDCCQFETSDRREMLLRGEGSRGDIFLACDCCGCHQMDCSDKWDINIDLDGDIVSPP